MIIRKQQMQQLEDELGDPVIPCSQKRVRGRKQPKLNNETGSGSPVSPESLEKLTWIEIQVVDLNGKPVAGIAYEVRLPDGTVNTGFTDEEGVAGYDEIRPGTCEVGFPELDADAWKPV
jgi:hypothetical protein